MLQTERPDYAAFISYRHVDPDRRWAKWLHRALETFRVPKGLRESHGLPARVGRVFRDEEELAASSDLSGEIEDALRRSDYLIVVCSPRTPASAWVNKEVIRFREMGRGDRILVLLIEGEPADSFPAALRAIREAAVEEGRSPGGSIEAIEPLAADVRPMGSEGTRHVRRQAHLRLLSPILGCRFDDLRRREEQRQRRRTLTWTMSLAVAVLAFAGLAALALAKQQEAAAERDAKAEALDEVLRLSDSKVARDLVLEADWLWPIHPERASAMADWLDRAGALVGQRKLHGGSLKALRERDVKSRETAWQEEVLVDLLADLDRLQPAGREDGLLADIRTRHERAATLRRVSIEGYRDAWHSTISGVASSIAYDGLRIVPQLGLVPLGPDPDSGLYEFAHLGSGAIPRRNPANGRLVYPEDAAIVLVLIPGVTFWMGAQRDPDRPNYDMGAYDDESDHEQRPVEVKLTAYFIAKHEMTQAQWVALTGELNPSHFMAGDHVGSRDITLRNPVEYVSWDEVVLWLGRHGLTLPSEAQWERACRAGTDTPWYSGREVASLQGCANVADRFMSKHLTTTEWTVTLEMDDGHAVHAPVGSFEPNGFGLHDMHGNVFEWCVDAYHEGFYATLAKGSAQGREDPRNDAQDFRVFRGGAWTETAKLARSAIRDGNPPEHRDINLGCRPARAVTAD